MIPLILFGLAVLALYATAETALVSADRIRLHKRVERGGRGTLFLRRVLHDPRTALSTTLAAIAGCTVLVSALAELEAHRRGEQYELVAEALITLAILVVGEVIPKSVGQALADRLYPVVAPFVWCTSLLLWPVLKFATLVSAGLLALIGIRETGRRGLLARADLEVLLREASTDAPHAHGSSVILGRVLSFSETTVAELMVPRTDIAAVDADASVHEALRLAAESQHSRLVVYDGQVDAVRGVVHVFDLLGGRSATVGPLARPIPIFPETVSSLDALNRLADASEQMAFVADEFGGWAGLISTGDLLEELTGRAPVMEPGREAPRIRVVGEHRWLVPGRTPIDDLYMIPGLEVPAGVYETLAGYLLHRTGTIPQAGTSVPLGPWRLTVTDATPRFVRTVRVERVGTDGRPG